MKRIIIFSLAVSVTLACLQPLAALAQDEDQKKPDKKEAKGKQKHSDRGTAQMESTHNDKLRKESTKTKSLPQERANVSQSRTKTSSQKNKPDTVREAVTIQNVKTDSHRNRTQQIQSQVQFVPRGTRSNRYDGRWFDANTHSDWGYDREHYWNHHHYRWYDGGWLIIDPGYSRGYATGGSVAAEVQGRLAELGYYRGPIDGYVGYGSRRSIANYQADYGLRPTGRIDEPLLLSMGLE